MRVVLRTLGMAVAFAMMGTSARAQDIGDVAGWYGMMATPFGALPPVVTPAMAGVTAADGRTPLSLDFRYGHWDFGGGEEPFNTFGLSGRARSFGVIVGYAKCEGCSDGILMTGVEFESVLATSQLGSPSSPSPSSLIVALRPGLGYAKPTGGRDGSAFSATVDVPLSLSVPVGTRARMVPFVVPGVGFGYFKDSDPTWADGESGVRASIGAGIGLLTTAGFGVHLGWRQVILEDAPSIVGVGISLAR